MVVGDRIKSCRNIFAEIKDSFKTRMNFDSVLLKKHVFSRHFGLYKVPETSIFQKCNPLWNSQSPTELSNSETRETSICYQLFNAGCPRPDRKTKTWFAQLNHVYTLLRCKFCWSELRGFRFACVSMFFQSTEKTWTDRIVAVNCKQRGLGIKVWYFKTQL